MNTRKDKRQQNGDSSKRGDSITVQSNSKNNGERKRKSNFLNLTTSVSNATAISAATNLSASNQNNNNKSLV